MGGRGIAVTGNVSSDLTQNAVGAELHGDVGGDAGPCDRRLCERVGEGASERRASECGVESGASERRASECGVESGASECGVESGANERRGRGGSEGGARERCKRVRSKGEKREKESERMVRRARGKARVCCMWVAGWNQTLDRECVLRKTLLRRPHVLTDEVASRVRQVCVAAAWLTETRPDSLAETRVTTTIPA